MTLYATATDRLATALDATRRTNKLAVRCDNTAQAALAVQRLSADIHRYRYVSVRSTAPEYGRHYRCRIIEYTELK